MFNWFNNSFTPIKRPHYVDQEKEMESLLKIVDPELRLKKRIELLDAVSLESYEFLIQCGFYEEKRARSFEMNSDPSLRQEYEIWLNIKKNV